MADRLGRELDLPDVAVGVNVPLPPTNAVSIYGRSGKLAVLNTAGTETILERVVTPQISIDGGNAATVPAHVALRIDFGLNA